MPNSAERGSSPITGAIMVILMIVAMVGFMVCIKQGIEESFPPNKTISKPVNK